MWSTTLRLRASCPLGRLRAAAVLPGVGRSSHKDYRDVDEASPLKQVTRIRHCDSRLVVPSSFCSSRKNSSSSGEKRQKFVLEFDKKSPQNDFESGAERRSHDPASVTGELPCGGRLASLLEDLPHRYREAKLCADPYIKLMRIDKPVGTWLLFWPGGWSLLLGAEAPLGPTLQALGLFLAGAFVMRGAGCTINDMWDRDIDSQVERTKSRPLVCGALDRRKALIFLAAQLSVGLAILTQFNWFSIALGASSMVLVVLYPLAKRVTNYPQLVLGLAFNWGALLGWATLHGSLETSICLPLYAAGVCWTVFYDTIYAHQDKKDDAIIGVKSTALTFGSQTKAWLAALEVGMLGGFGWVGYAANLDWPYYAALGAVGAHLTRQIVTLDIDNPSNCAERFVSNKAVGLLIFLGILLGKWDTFRELLPFSQSAPAPSQMLPATASATSPAGA